MGYTSNLDANFSLIPLSEKNLQEEKVHGNIYVIGNTVIDALHAVVDKINTAALVQEQNQVLLNPVMMSPVSIVVRNSSSSPAFYLKMKVSWSYDNALFPLLSQLWQILKLIFDETKSFVANLFIRAVRCAVNEWEAICRYVNNGQAEIDNNTAYPNFFIIQTSAISVIYPKVCL